MTRQPMGQPPYKLLKCKKVQFPDSTIYIYKDSSGNLSFTDAVTGTKTMAELASGAVTSIGEYGDANLLTGAVKLEEGSNITITRSAAHNALIIASAAGGASTAGTICLHPNAAILHTTGGATRVQVDGTNHAYEVCDFPTASVTKADWHFTVPRDYDGGNVTVNIVWIATATSGGVVFDANYLSVGDSAQYDASLTNVACAAVTVDGTQWDTNLSTCTLTTPFTAGQTAIIRIHRETADGSDTMVADARVIMVELQYTRSSA